MIKQAPYLTVVFPAYNEAKRLPAALRKTAEYFRDWNKEIEVIIVDNGSTDKTVKNAMATIVSLYSINPNISFYVTESKKGKGFACRRGIEVANGERILITDVDLSTPLSALPRLLSYLLYCDLVIGSRMLSESVVIGRDKNRRFTGRAFNFLVSGLVGNIKDTQCGFKLITTEAARWIEPLLTIGGYAWDVELIYVAQALGYRVAEVPVTWQHNKNSKVNIIRDSFKMTREIMQIKTNDKQGKYHP